MAKVLTDNTVKQAKPNTGLDPGDPIKRAEYPDAGITGLYLIVQPSGKRSWAVRYRHDGKPRKLTIGPYPRIGLASARQLARKALLEVSEGGDPASDKRRRRQGGEATETFEAVADRFISTYAKRQNKSWPEIKRLIDVEVMPHWKHKPLAQIRRKDVLILLEAIEQRAPFTANRVFTVVRRFFTWCVEKDLIAISPCDGLKKPTKEISRDRVLDDNELRWLWQACDDLGAPLGGFVRMLLLSGQRRNEVAGISDAELTGSTWIIPAERTKNAREHAITLPDAAITVLAAMPRLGEAGLYFTTTGIKPISGFGPAKLRIDAAMLARAKAEGVEHVKPWVFHDIRRTVASNMAKLGIAVHVTEAVLNHKSGTVSGIAAVYNRHDYAAEKAQALSAWANYLLSVATDQPRVNVVSLRG
jgi:integrase